MKQEEAKMLINGEYTTRKQKWNAERESSFSQFQRELMWLESGFVSSLYAYDNDYRDEGREETSESRPMPSDFSTPEQSGNESKKRGDSHGDDPDEHSH